MSDYITVDPEAALFWAKCNQGHWLGARWSDALRRHSRILSEGGRPEIRWWKREVRRDHSCGAGMIEVIALPRERRRRRRRRRDAAQR